MLLPTTRTRAASGDRPERHRGRTEQNYTSDGIIYTGIKPPTIGSACAQPMHRRVHGPSGSGIVSDGVGNNGRMTGFRR